MDKLYIIDALNFLFRSYYAIKGMTNPQGESTNALYGFIRSIYKIMKDFSPDHLVIVFDGPDNKKGRTDIYSEYKSHRKEMPEDLFPQLEQAIKFCEIAGLPNLSVPNVEADDTIGSIAKWAEKKHTLSYLCSSDKDLCQLVSDHVFVINISKDNMLVDRKKVEELHGVKPEQIVDLLAMVGDASDNIPGLEGFGPKTAAALLNKFDTLDNILANPDQVPGEKKQEVLRQGKEIAHLSRRLATIDLNVPFPKEENFFKLKQPDLEKMREFYREMNFMSLLKDIDTEQVTPKQHYKEEKDVDYRLIDSDAELECLISQLMHAKEICIDTETDDIRPMWARLVGIGLSVEPKKAWYIPLNGSMSRHAIVQKLKPLLENPAIGFYGHNLKYDLHVLLNEGLQIGKISFDTILASYLLNPEKQRHNLDLLSLEKFGKVKIPIEELIGKGKKQISMKDVPLEKIKDYCCEDVDYTCRLKELFQKEIEAQGLSNVLENIEMPLLPVLLSMERDGIYVDQKKLEKLSHELAHEIKALEHKIYEMAGHTFNINSPKQLSALLFEKMGLKPTKKTETGYSTSADVLETLREEAPIVKSILAYRTLEKLRSTYADSLPHDIFPKTERIHCTFNQSVAATGRLSCQDPNLQNIPIRTKEGIKIRECFKPERADWSYVAGDYSQIELRLLAHLSEDPILLKAFNAGEDIHAYTASVVFDIPLQKVTPEMRHQAKAVNFGILYGQQAFGLSQQLGIEYKDAAIFIETYFERYKKVKEFLNFCKEGARKTGRVVTMTGRQRPIPEIHSKNPMVRAAAERLAINTPLQGTVADLIKLAMIEIKQLLEMDNDAGFMILQIHDELLFEVPDNHAPRLAKIVKDCMENVLHLKVPLAVNISIGKNWGEC